MGLTKIKEKIFKSDNNIILTTQEIISLFHCEISNLTTSAKQGLGLDTKWAPFSVLVMETKSNFGIDIED